VDVLSEIEIARPREHVAAFACDSDNATRWYVNIKSVVWQTPRPMAVGSRLEFDAQFLGAGWPTPTRLPSTCRASGS